jgi:hypothetical protein
MLQSVLKGFAVFLLAAPIFIGLQSLVYTIAMEFIVRPKAHLRHVYLVVSCMLGTASRLAIDVTFDDYPFFTIIGSITGLPTGLILYDKNMQSSLSIKLEVEQK